MISEQPFPRKLHILADNSGRIVAAGIIEERAGNNAPTRVSIVPSEGQFVRVVEIPEDFPRNEHPAEVLKRYRLRVEGDRAQLVLEGHQPKKRRNA